MMIGKIIENLTKYLSMALSFIFVVIVLSIMDEKFTKIYFGSNGITIEKQREYVNIINDLERRIERLENNRIKIEDVEAKENITDLVKVSNNYTIYKNVVGYIWIGNYDIKRKIWIKRT